MVARVVRAFAQVKLMQAAQARAIGPRLSDRGGHRSRTISLSSKVGKSPSRRHRVSSLTADNRYP